MFIFGHSSDWRWNKGDYKTVFMRLPEIIVGDEIYVWYQGTQYHYQVSETHIVDPTDISWLPNAEKLITILSNIGYINQLKSVI